MLAYTKYAELHYSQYLKLNYGSTFQVRPGSVGISSGSADKIQPSRTEIWTKDVIHYLQTLLDEFFSRNNSHSTLQNRERSPQMPYAGTLLHKSDPLSSFSAGEEPSSHFRWWYIVRLLQWHHAEGLILPSLVIDWVLNQLQVFTFYTSICIELVLCAHEIKSMMHISFSHFDL